MLSDLYSRLCRMVPKEEGALVGLPVSSGHPLWLSINQKAFPALLLPARRDDLRADIHLRAVDVLFSRICEIETVGEQSNSGCYTIIRLKEDNVDVVRLFLKILEETFCRGRVSKDNAEIAADIQEVAALFSRVNDGSCDLIGLWGELYVIDRSSDTDAAVRCWSSYKKATYDFVTDCFVLDVKTTMSTHPKHRFSLEQLRPNGSFGAYIASLCVVEIQAGQTVAALMESVERKLRNLELLGPFLAQCLAKGGADLRRNELTLRTYPDDGALVFYKAHDIPSPVIGAADPIENVKFDVDLSSVGRLETNEQRKILMFDSLQD